jgi:hypothetical protein
VKARNGSIAAWSPGFVLMDASIRSRQLSVKQGVRNFTVRFSIRVCFKRQSLLRSRDGADSDEKRCSTVPMFNKKENR